VFGNVAERATGVIVVPVDAEKVPRIGGVGIDFDADRARWLGEFGESGKPYLLIRKALDGALEDGPIPYSVTESE
jgi:hypothetical protein